MTDRPRLWKCQECGREFANRNQSHSCGRHTLAHHFRGKPPAIRALFDGVVAAIRAICLDVTIQHPITIEFVDSNAPETVPRDVGLGLFRVIHEALDNAVRHSRARVVIVELSGRGPWNRSGMAVQEIQLQVSDDGMGFDPEAVDGRGLGLIHMRERLNLVGGQLLVSSKPGEGTTVSARISFVPHTATDPQLSLDPM